MSRALRLLEDGPADGPWNMAVDQVLFASAAEGRAALRLYRWTGPWLSLGRSQSVDADRLRAWAEAGVGAVRRPTGGRAVLHGQDLTYALAVPAAWLPGSVAEGHHRVAEALRAALRALGVPAEPAPADAAPARGFDCFAVAAAHEPCVAGRKLAGSAQRRSAAAVLQHGSLRLGPDPAPIVRAAGLAPEASTSLAELGAEVGEEALRDALRHAFAEAFGAVLASAGLEAPEAGAARQRAGFLRSEALHAPRGPEAPQPQGGP